MYCTTLFIRINYIVKLVHVSRKCTQLYILLGNQVKIDLSYLSSCFLLWIILLHVVHVFVGLADQQLIARYISQSYQSDRSESQIRLSKACNAMI